MIPRHIANPINDWLLNRLRSKQWKKANTVLDIAKKVSGVTKVSLREIYSKTRKREVVESRFIILYFSYKRGLGTQAEITSNFNCGHEMVIHATKTVNNLIDTDKNFADLINNINRQL
ncbi:hypothetical protein KAR91_46235 [Candidatus Pacearchaeota archaeon]|nr:hypothetical protein [Candidatus Pacearchaeota archaeon]